MQLSLDGLRAKLSDFPGNQAMLEEVRHELALRSTLGAKRLRREVEALLADTATITTTAKSTKKLPEAQPPDSESDTASRLVTEGIPDLHARYAALRTTFTAEAEILSRWGMTSLAPPAVRDAVFRYWQETLLDPSGQHPLGLSCEDLERDIAALASEKRGN